MAAEETNDEKHGVACVTREVDKDDIASDKVVHVSEKDVKSVTVEATSDRSSSSEDDGEYPSGLRFGLILLSVYATTVLTAVDMNIVATAVPRLTDDFHTVVGVGWYASAFRLCYCAFLFLFGKAYVLFSAKRVYLLSNAIWIVGIVLCGAAVSPAMFITGRAIAGLGTAGLSSGTETILVHTIPIQKRSMYQGLEAAIEGLSVLVGPLLGGVLTQYLNWRWCFYINLPFGGVCLLFTIFCLDHTYSRTSNETLKQRIKQLDIISNILIISSLTSLFLALGWAGTRYSWSSGTIIGLLTTFTVLLIAFIFNQYRRGDSAVLPLRIFKRLSVAASLVFVLTLNSAGNVLDYYLPTYFQAAHGYSPAHSGYLMIPIIISATAAAIIQGIGLNICGHYGPFLVASATGMSVAAGLISTFGATTGLGKLIGYTLLSGFSYGFGIAAPAISIQFALPKEDIPLGMSTMLFMASLGPAVAIAVGQVLLTTELDNRLRSVPGFNGESTVDNGLTEFVSDAPDGQKERIFAAIAASMRPLWYMVIGLACATVVVTMFIKWRSIKVKEEAAADQEQTSDSAEKKAETSESASAS